MSQNYTCFFKEEVGFIYSSFMPSDVNSTFLELYLGDVGAFPNIHCMYIYVQPVSPISNGLELKVITMSWLLISLGQA